MEEKNDFHSVIAVAGAALGMQIFVTTARAEPRRATATAVGNTCCLVGYHVCRVCWSAGRVSLLTRCQSLNQNVTWRGSFAWRLLGKLK